MDTWAVYCASPNAGKIVDFRRQAAKATGILPLDYMLSVMRDPKADDKRRDAMATAAAPYPHAKLAAAEQSASQDKPMTNSIEVVFVHPKPQPDEDVF
jgi:hypothetical protein